VSEENQSFTNLVQLPAMRYPNGSIQLFPAEVLEKAATPQLEKFAEMMDAKVVFLKMRAYYSTLETKLCQMINCWNLDEHNGMCFNHKGNV
jgi:hypothetical protein